MVEPDHLGSPRAVIDPVTKAVLWRWRPSNDPFGTMLPEEDADGDGIPFVFDLRFPGQRYDSVTGLYYNYRRDYDAASGRYIQVDPIGLAGGINPYLYANGSPWAYVDPLGLYAWGDPLPDWIVDFSAGLGDTVSFGATRWLRRKLGSDGVVNICSGAYSGGEWAGVGLSIGTGLAGGIRAAGAKGAGKEFSHWIPKRMGGPRSTWNGNYVSRETHALSDPYRYRFMSRAWKEKNPMPLKLHQQWTRFPNVYKGASAGAAYGAASMRLSGDCSCEH